MHTQCSIFAQGGTVMKQTDRDFLSKIKKAVFTNPFGQDRFEIDLAATGMESSASSKEVLSGLIHKIGNTIEQIARNREEHDFSQEDAILLQYGRLFHVFHLFSDGIDEHIRTQVQLGDEKCRVSFGRDILQKLNEYGFDDSQSLRFLELFFQMRRAFYFISRIIGSSDCMMNLRKTLWNNIFTGDIRLYDEFLWNRMEDFSTMLLGETGTGKGLAASAIGRSGYIPYDFRTSTFKESFARTFISINLSQFPEQLIESELFGHKKGAFTGAVDSHQGIFGRCSPHGAIFLDEIGEVSNHVQIKLLRVLQDRLFTPVGSHKTETFSGRVIAATNRSISAARQDGTFRDDFYYRLCSDVIVVPPLRQRLEENRKELAELLEITISRILGKAPKEIVSTIFRIIEESAPAAYGWPGNIRELEQCTRQIILNNRYDWQQSIAGTQPQDCLAASIAKGNLTASELLGAYCRLHHDRLGTYEAVAKLTGLDRRTVKKYVSSCAGVIVVEG